MCKANWSFINKYKLTVIFSFIDLLDRIKFWVVEDETRGFDLLLSKVQNWLKQVGFVAKVFS